MPSAINKRGKKIAKYGEKWDSEKELLFYERFIKGKWTDDLVKVHPKFSLIESREIDQGAKVYSISYTPDIVIYTPEGKIKHAYDVKNSFTPYAIDNGNKLTFRLFAMKYRVPVEVVVIRTHDFKSCAFGITKPLRTLKTGKAPDPIIRTNPDYNWIEATNY